MIPNLAAFADAFATGEPKPVSAEDLGLAEAQLGARLSSQHRRFLLSVGSVRCARLLGAIEQENCDLPSLEGILGPDAIVAMTKRYRTAGMPSDLVVLGLDASGNAVCTRVGSETVVLFDHESGKTTLVAADLEALLADYLKIGEAK